MDEIKWCIGYLKEYNKLNGLFNLPDDLTLRALMNITMPINLSDEFYTKQNIAIKDIYKSKQIVDVNNLHPIYKNIYLYKGDITLIKADAIVNACNEKLLGCFSPLHSCIDNAIHSFAGLQVRRDLMIVMNNQGFDEPNGKAKITPGYNLPAKYILHTVGPKAFLGVTKQNEEDLYSCYISCLNLANEYKLNNIVFCSISTGVYGYPINKACKVAIKAVLDYLDNNKNTTIEKVVFNVFSREDYDVYNRTITELNR